jgi:maleylacetate reductase
MMDSFIFPGLTTRVVFGAGTMARVEEEVRRLGHDKALVLSTPHQRADAEKLAESLHGLAVGIFPGAVMHTPVEVTDRVLEAFRASGASAVVSLGAARPPGWAKPSPFAPAPIRLSSRPPTPARK